MLLLNQILSMLRWINNRETPRSSLVLRSLIEKCWEVRICHVFREGNRVADGLAKLALAGNYGMQILRSPPSELLGSLHADAAGRKWSEKDSSEFGLRGCWVSPSFEAKK